MINNIDDFWDRKRDDDRKQRDAADKKKKDDDYTDRVRKVGRYSE